MSIYQKEKGKQGLYEPIIFVDESRRKGEPQPAIIFSREPKREEKQQSLEKLENPIDRVFQNINSLARIPSQTIMSDNPTNSCQQAFQLPVQKFQERFPVVATTQALDQQNGTPTFRKSRTQIKPIDLEKKLKACLNIRVKGESVYVFTGHFYQKISAQDTKRIICRYCSAEISENGGAGIMEQAYKLLLVDPDLAVDHFPANRTLVCFRNGVLNLETNTFSPHDPKYLLTFELECTYPVGTSLVSPNFDKFLSEAMEGDQGLVDRIWEMLGYILSPDQAGKVFFILQGVGNSGKSMLCDLLGSFFPESEVTSMDVKRWKERFSLAELADKLLCIANDMENSALDNGSVSNIKKFTGNDLLTADVKYSTARAFRATGKLILVSNHPVLTKIPDMAFENRIVAVPFLHSVPKEEWDLQLLEKLKRERSAIAYKAIQAYFRLRRNQYQFSGDYVVNSADCFADSASSATNIETAVYTFVRTTYEQGHEGDYVCIADAYEHFQVCHGSVSQSLFSQNFSRFAEELYGGQKVRSRMGQYANARWCIQGMRSK